MKLRCERDVLVEAFNTARRGVADDRWGGIGGGGVRLEVTGDQLELTGASTDLTIHVRVPVGGGTDGVCVVPARLTADIVRALEPGAVTIEGGGDDERASITSGRSHFTVNEIPSAEFPQLLRGAGGPGVTVDAAQLNDAMRQVVRAASTNVDRPPILTGVLLSAENGSLWMAATDTYRLALREMTGADMLREGQKVVVPGRALVELQRLVAGVEQVTVSMAEHDATFEVGDVTVTTRLLLGEFPNYRHLIPSGYRNRLTVNRETLLDALRRVRLLVPETTSAVHLNLRSTGVEVTAKQEKGAASEEVDAKYEGTEMSVAFNVSFFIDGIEALTSEELVLEMGEPLKPAVMRATDDEAYLYLLMPIRSS